MHVYLLTYLLTSFIGIAFEDQWNPKRLGFSCSYSLNKNCHRRPSDYLSFFRFQNFSSIKKMYSTLHTGFIVQNYPKRFQVVLIQQSQWSCSRPGFWRFASPRLRLGIVASLHSIVSQHIIWLVYTVQWEQRISSTVGSIRSDTHNTTYIKNQRI